MKLGTMAVTAALALLTFSLTPAEAGQKARKHQQWTEHGNVHIDSHVSSKNLKALEKQLKGHQKAAVSEELHHRQLSYEKRSREQYAKDLGEALTNLKGEQAILNLWGAGTHFGTKHKHGH